MTAQPVSPPVPGAPQPVDIDALLRQINDLQAKLVGLGAVSTPPPEPRFKSIFDLLRELARNVLHGGVGDEFLRKVDGLDPDFDDGTARDEAEAAAKAQAAAAVPVAVPAAAGAPVDIEARIAAAVEAALKGRAAGAAPVSTAPEPAAPVAAPGAVGY